MTIEQAILKELEDYIDELGIRSICKIPNDIYHRIITINNIIICLTNELIDYMDTISGLRRDIKSRYIVKRMCLLTKEDPLSYPFKILLLINRLSNAVHIISKLRLDTEILKIYSQYLSYKKFNNKLIVIKQLKQEIMKLFENKVSLRSNKRLKLFIDRNITDLQINDIENSAKYYTIKETLVDIIHRLDNIDKPDKIINNDKKYVYCVYKYTVNDQLLYGIYLTWLKAKLIEKTLLMLQLATFDRKYLIRIEKVEVK